jgi:hypothetical protein
MQIGAPILAEYYLLAKLSQDKIRATNLKARLARFQNSANIRLSEEVRI